MVQEAKLSHAHLQEEEEEEEEESSVMIPPFLPPPMRLEGRARRRRLWQCNLLRSCDHHLLPVYVYLLLQAFCVCTSSIVFGLSSFRLCRASLAGVTGLHVLKSFFLKKNMLLQLVRSKM